jgi:hypothetical protein
MDYRQLFLASSLALGLLSLPAMSMTTSLSDRVIEVVGAEVKFVCPPGDPNCAGQQLPPRHFPTQAPNSYSRKPPPPNFGEFKPPKYFPTQVPNSYRRKPPPPNFGEFKPPKPCPPGDPKCHGPKPPPPPPPPPPGDHKPPKHRHNHDFNYWWSPGYYFYPGYVFEAPPVYDYYGVTCNEARAILRYEGFKNIKLQKCGGTYHQFTAKRRGKTYLIKVRARNGQIIIVRRL